MDWQRTLLISGMAITAWLLVIQWNNFNDQRAKVVDSFNETVIEQTPYFSDPSSIEAEEEVLSQELPTVIQSGKENSDIPLIRDLNLIEVRTDVLQVYIDPVGGDIVKVTLLDYLDELSAYGEPITLLDNSPDSLYISRSGIIGKNATDTVNGRPVFTSRASEYYLLDGETKLEVDLTYSQGDVDFIKRFTFTDQGYVIDVSYFIDNKSFETWNGIFYGQIKRNSRAPYLNDGRFGPAAFLGAAIREPEKNFAKYEFEDIEEGSIQTSIDGGWVSMVQLYFISAWIPPKDQNNNFSLRKITGKDEYIFSYTSEPLSIFAGESGTYSSQFYVGPKDQKVLAGLADYLDLTIDYGFLWMVGKPIFWTMEKIESYVGNWGWAIVLVTLLIKFGLYPLSKASLKSMAKMRELQPELTRLKELYGDDRQKFSQEMMGVYKREKVNPAGGCFPILLQMPVFIALYWVLLESVEIRHAPWILWIEDLSARDPYFILPLIMGGSMLLMQKTQPMPTDPLQAKIFKFMPIAFTLFCMSFPSGLVLYWTINNVISMIQQYYVQKQIKKPVKG